LINFKIGREAGRHLNRGLDRETLEDLRDNEEEVEGLWKTEVAENMLDDLQIS